MSKKKLSFRQFKIGHLDEVLTCVERVLRSHGLDFYILGGLARDIHFLQEGYQPRRITRDVDIAVFIPVSSKYDALLEELIANESFSRTTGNPVRLRHPAGVIVDILPFNEGTSANSGMAHFGPALADFNLKGLLEVYQFSADEVEIEDGHRYKVASLEAIMMLKFMAFDSKPEWRQKDMEDIGLLWKHYFDFNDIEIYDHYFDLFDPDRSLTAIASRVIGRKISVALSFNAALLQQFESVLEKYATDKESHAIAILCKEMELMPEEVTGLMEEMREGVREGDDGK